MARQITIKAECALRGGYTFKRGNTQVKIHPASSPPEGAFGTMRPMAEGDAAYATLWLFGNHIATLNRYSGNLAIHMRGWPTVTTRERLTYVAEPMHQLRQEQGYQLINSIPVDDDRWIYLMNNGEWGYAPNEPNPLSQIVA